MHVSSQVLDTLDTIIAPGNRVRLSPYVEQAQFTKLFGEAPDEKSRHESSRQLLTRHKERIEGIAARWMTFWRENNLDFQSNTYSEDGFLDAYLTYYFSTNLPKIQLVLLDLARQGLIPKKIHLLDVGVGTGTTAIAVIDFLLAWGEVCALYGQPLPVTDLHLTGLDQSPQAVEYTREVIVAYTSAVLQRANRTGEDTLAVDLSARLCDSAQKAELLQLDLDVAMPAAGHRPNIVVMMNVLNELHPAGERNAAEFLKNLPKDTLVILVEPGAPKNAQALMRRRIEFMRAGFHSVAPCAQGMPLGHLSTCEPCWTTRRESFHQPLLYRAFRQACCRLGLDRNVRSYDKFENKLLTWSYVVLQKGAQKPSPRPSRCHTLVPGERASGPLHLRHMGSRPPTHEIMNCCLNTGNGPVRLTLRREAGFQIPPLGFGHAFRVSDVHVERRSNGRFCLIPDVRTKICPERDNTVGHGFVSAYTDLARSAVDALAYRLFGFPAMRDFQHQILSRVLLGHNILAVAATGGGKSECFILPAMLLPGLTIVVAPLKSLMIDQYEQRLSRRFGLANLATYINGDVSLDEREKRLRRMELGYYKLVYFTPEQLERGHILDSVRRADENVGVRYLAMDEAHCISQWGHDFRPSYLNILQRFRDKGLNPRVIALTATASPYVREDICEELSLSPQMIETGGDVLVHSSNRPELNLVVRVTQSTEEKATGILQELKNLEDYNKRHERPGAALIFMPHTGGNPETTAGTQNRHSTAGRLRPGVTPFASFLERTLERQVAIYHSKIDEDTSKENGPPEQDPHPERPPGDLSGRTRQGEQTAFIEGQRDIMVATKGFGMGIDKPDIRRVIHRSPPGNLEAYAQEAGRAGRDGEPATAILYYSPTSPDGRPGSSDYGIQAFFLTDRYVRREDVQVMRAFLKTMMDQRCRTLGNETLLYFTNDEAIEFFDRCTADAGCAALDHTFCWPEFEESQSTKMLLIRGKLYQEKTKYLARILNVMLRIRPDIAGQGKRLSLLQRFQETRACVRKPQVKRWDLILGSNRYYGDLLRSRGITESRFRHGLCAPDVLNLATDLGMSVTELMAMLADIKFDGRDANSREVGVLLDYTKTETPNLGPAEDVIYGFILPPPPLMKLTSFV